MIASTNIISLIASCRDACDWLTMESVPSTQSDKAISTLYEISKLLDTGLDQNTLRILVGLCQAGEISQGPLLCYSKPWLHAAMPCCNACVTEQLTGYHGFFDMQGVNPQALAHIVKELRREAAALRAVSQRQPHADQ